jgi:hypothetical protein
MRRAVAGLAAALVCATGCGSPSADLFEVKVSGPDKNANYTLVVSDGGSVTCNGAAAKAMGDERLIKAREVAREISKQAELGIELPPGPGAILRYRARVEAGTVAFSDTSTGRPQSFNMLVAFSTDVAENVCGLER